MTHEDHSKVVSQGLNKLAGVEFDKDLPNKKACISSESVDTLLETLEKEERLSLTLAQSSQGLDPWA
ncbi:unnamed protein product [Gulo gulo]|uniref:Uncharacterized protein n=1 Tax=Gulo gulo TaxID=48420 RepID=A0A9X9Q986_GULGU|nr:unnamed protein product [Gulo gulo]